MKNKEQVMDFKPIRIFNAHKILTFFFIVMLFDSVLFGAILSRWSGPFVIFFSVLGIILTFYIMLFIVVRRTVFLEDRIHIRYTWRFFAKEDFIYYRDIKKARFVYPGPRDPHQIVLKMKSKTAPRFICCFPYHEDFLAARDLLYSKGIFIKISR